MFSLSSSHRYFLYQGRCDMRKAFDGLCGLVSTELGRNPTSGEVFVFLNRPRTGPISNCCIGKTGALFCIINDLKKERFHYPKQWMGGYH